MTVALSEFEAHPGKYFELAKEDEVIVTKRGESTWRLEIVEDESVRRRREAFQYFREFAEGGSLLPPEYNDPNYDPNYELIRDERLRKKGLI